MRERQHDGYAGRLANRFVRRWQGINEPRRVALAHAVELSGDRRGAGQCTVGDAHALTFSSGVVSADSLPSLAMNALTSPLGSSTSTLSTTARTQARPERWPARWGL
jgi:hypothetical protein